MELIAEETLQAIRERVSIVSVISKYVALKKSGTNFKGVCPFHTEKTPSFMVSEGKRIYHCFGCGKGGNVFTFLMDHRGMTFLEAVERLAVDAGISLKLKTPEHAKMDQARQSQKQLFFKLNKFAMIFFKQALHKNQDAQLFLKKRGLQTRTIEQFHIGYAPSGWDFLKRHLLQQRVTLEDLIASGLVIASDRKGYDRFRDRLIFPIVDLEQRVLGFSGRALRPQDSPKYLNSPDTLLFNKGRELYGLVQGIKEISKKGVIIVEGYFDCLLLHQFGFSNVVATMGTALTTDHILRLKRFTDQFYVFFDSDDAGKLAAKRCLPLFLDQSISPKMIELESVQDPDEFVIQEGSEALGYKIAQAKSLFNFVIRTSGGHPNLEAADKAKIVKEIGKFLEKVPTTIEQMELIRKLADQLNLPENMIHETLDLKVQARPSSVPNLVQKINEEKEQVEIEIVEFIALFPNWTVRLVQEKTLDLLGDPEIKEVLFNMIKTYEKHQTIDFSEILGKIKNLHLQTRVRKGVLEKEAQQKTENQWDEVFKISMRRLKRKYLEQQERVLFYKIRKLEEGIHPENLKLQLLSQYQELIKQKQTL